MQMIPEIICHFNWMCFSLIPGEKRATSQSSDMSDKGNKGNEGQRKKITNVDLNHSFIGYSTMPETTAYSGENEGTPYLQYWAKYLEKYYRSLDFRSIYQMVQQEMARQDQGDGSKQPVEEHGRLPLKLNFGDFMEPVSVSVNFSNIVHPMTFGSCHFWLIWFINQRALYSHALSVMCYPVLVLASVHTSPWHRVGHRNLIFGTHMQLCPSYI